MKKIMGLLMVLGLMVSFGGCGKDSDSPTGPSEEGTEGPQGQTLEVKTEEWDNGNIKVEFQFYRAGESVIKHGYYKEYYESGEVEWEVNFVDGKLDGKGVVYYESGKVMVEGNYVDGKKEGKKVYYDEEGNITDEDIYENDVCVEKCDGNE